MSHYIEKTSRHGATVDGKFISWELLKAAASQDDIELSAIYSGIQNRAKKMEAKRLVSEDWQQYGYPIRTGFGRQYAGQIVMRAWEIRRKQHHGADARVAYIVTWDRSVNTFTRVSSPDLPDMAACYA